MHQAPIPSGGGLVMAIVVIAAMVGYALPHGLILGAALVALVEERFRLSKTAAPRAELGGLRRPEGR